MREYDGDTIGNHGQTWKTDATYGGMSERRIEYIQDPMQSAQQESMLWSIFKGDPALTCAIIIFIVGAIVAITSSH